MAAGRIPTTANSPITAKGDLFTFSTAPARLAVGNNGDSLVADSSTSTGLRYTAGTVQANPILNSAMQVWQRNTSIACSTTAYTADRWQGYRSVAGATVSRQATGDTTNLPNIQYCARVQRDSSNTSTATIYLAQTLETVNSIPYAGKTVTFSYYARKGADFSGSGALRVTLQQGTGTDQNVLTSMSSSTVVNVNASLTTTWQRFSGTGTVNTTTTQLGLFVDFNPTGTAGAADFVEITGVQIDIDSVALPFRTYAGTIQGELAACQRYYYLHSTGSGKGVAMGTYYSGSDMRAFVGLPVTMRTTPTLSAGSGTNYYRIISAGVSTDYFNSFTLEAGYAQTAIIQNSTEVSGTAGYAGIVSCESGANSFVAFSAEL